jgi:alpha-glucosidase
MPWTREGGWNDPWLPLEDTSRNVEDQRADPGSTLHFTRDLIALRKQLAELRSGAYTELPSPKRAWAWQRGESTVVAINFGQDATEIEGVEGSVALATRREREGERVERTLRLEPAEGVIIT